MVGGALHEATTVIAADGRWWRVVADASLRNWTPELRCEAVSPILQYDDLPLLQTMVRAVRKAGATVDARCAIHIHVDAALFTGTQLCTLAKLVYQQEELLYAALGISEARAAISAGQPSRLCWVKKDNCRGRAGKKKYRPWGLTPLRESQQCLRSTTETTVGRTYLV